MSKTPNYDAKVKAILDATQPGERTCELTGEKWVMDEEEISWYKKFNVPPSKRSPLTRWWCETAYFLANQWWYNKHAETGKPILTFIHPATGIRVLPDAEWFDRDFASKGRDIDVSRQFFDQLRELQLDVPLPADQNVEEPHNSIAKFSTGDVNSYFMMFCKSKNSLYSHWAFDVEDSAELWNVSSVTNSYSISDSHRIFNCKFVRESFDCLNSMFLFDCRNCEFCFGASNKRNRKYLWWNEQLSKEEWESRMAQVNLSSWSDLDRLLKQFHAMVEQSVWPENFNEKAEESLGEYLTNVNNLRYGYMCLDGVHDSFYVNYGSGDSYDCAYTSGAFSSNNVYYSTNAPNSSAMKFTHNCQRSQNLEYSMVCFNCENCFGCIGLNRKQFHIFNQPYSEEEYWKKVDEIKCVMLDRGEYGEWFPVSMSPGYFPDSGAPIYFGAPVSVGKEQLGALEFDPESEGAMGSDIMQGGEPESLNAIPGSLEELDALFSKRVFFDPDMKRRFTFIKPLVAFHQKHQLALPPQHPLRRMQLLQMESNSGKFEKRSCDACEKDMLIGHNAIYPHRTIYCKSCYLKYLEKNG